MFGPRICLCHRNRLLSECLAGSLDKTEDVKCQVMLPEELLSIALTSNESDAIDLLLLDATLDDDLSTRVAQRVQVLFPTCKVMLLIGEHALDRMFELAQIGGHGCLYEGVGLSEVLAAVQTVLKGQPYCSQQLANALVAQVGQLNHSREWPTEADERILTSREREVLELVAFQQLGNKQIARQLGLSLYTVKNHIHNLIEKLGVQDRHEAVQHARRRGLLVGAGTELRQGATARLPR